MRATSLLRRTALIGLVPCAGLLFGAGVGGCASGTQTTATTSTGATLCPPGAAVVGKDLVPGRAGTERWLSLEGLDRGVEYDVVTGPSDVAGASFCTAFGNREITYWSLAPDGSVLLHAVDSLSDKARSIFSPPLLIAPATLTGPALESRSSMRVVSTANLDRLLDEGTAVRSVQHVGDEPVRIDGSDHVAQVVDTRFEARLRGATARRRAILWVVPSVGILGESWVKRVTILNVFPQESVQVTARVGVHIPLANPLVGE